IAGSRACRRACARGAHVRPSPVVRRLALVLLVACRGGGGDATSETPAGAAAPSPVTLGIARKVDVEQAGAGAVLAGGAVACWGNGSATPRIVPDVTGAIEVKQSCARRGKEPVMCWNGELVAREIAGSEGALDIARGEYGPCIVTATRDVACLD